MDRNALSLVEQQPLLGGKASLAMPELPGIASIDREDIGQVARLMDLILLEKLSQGHALHKIATTLDTGELIEAVCAQIAGEPGETPVSELIEAWKSWPEPDFSRPALTPSHCCSLGRYVAGVVADIMATRLEQALARQEG
jgi:hypothetical protein